MEDDSFSRHIIPRALGMNKLVLYSGLEYYHDSPLIPKELLEIRPLAEYEMHEATKIVMNGYTMEKLYERFLNNVPFDQKAEMKRTIELGLISQPGLLDKAKKWFKR